MGKLPKEVVSIGAGRNILTGAVLFDKGKYSAYNKTGREATRITKNTASKSLLSLISYQYFLSDESTQNHLERARDSIDVVLIGEPPKH